MIITSFLLNLDNYISCAENWRKIAENYDHNIVFAKFGSLHWLCGKMAKIAENYDHNIDPR
jgi:hypothetical protein